MLANLISNAIKFVPSDRQPRVQLRTEEDEERVRLWVEDNGTGIPARQEERIFRLFERLDEGRLRPGTGIGLAIVRRGMERMGGQAGVTTPSDGEGSRFWVEMEHGDTLRQAPQGKLRR